MKWLLDTNVISEPGKPRPHPKAMAWLAALDESACAVSVLTMGEIEKGIHTLPPGPARARREAGLKALRLRFSGRVLDVDARVAAKWGELLGDAERRGRPLPAVGNLIAATAAVHGLTLATRDTGDIAPGVAVFNPFA
jgi:predicted nucleic acid-binding protein